ncbi:hypothetical protein SEA_LISARA_77 [Arthrobacter phage LiSara]|uniref:Uncharacterized protein n=2 Tax=Laroyevirus TaxID=1982086 RepID=A0A0U4JCC0_9CAUD|nr:hypothetical protein FDH64_gp80 [Arthrobacter phage Laroye]YP_010082590.1 hypothetical protein KMD21_gp77 [Arthrobacter phage LiSara]ALY09605.1 hypothetical protein LAROYE_80 [Arthrobacter phage Laroye]ASR83661.1 hypothetical protein SEA_LISARA_77 [Arthrobacter phage LiSara]
MLTTPNSLLYAWGTGQPERKATRQGVIMHQFTVTVTAASTDEIKITHTRTVGSLLSRVALRTLMLQTAANEMGVKAEVLFKAGYDRLFDTGWTVLDAGPDGNGMRTMFYTVRPMTGVERQQQLHERGGSVTNPDGSMGFFMPGEAPAPKVQRPKVRRQK